MGKWKLRLGYGVADLASNLIFGMISSYLLIFYTDVFGLAAGVAGSLMVVSRFVDGITDVIMGMAIDRTNTRWGKSRPYFLFGAIPFAVIAIATFSVPNLSEQGKIIYAFVTYIALNMAYTVVNIPLSSILPSLTDDEGERNILVTVRMICSMIGATIVTTFTVPMVQTLGNGNAAKGYQITMIIYAIIGAFLFFVTFKNTEEKVKQKSVKVKSSIKEDIKALNLQSIIFCLFTFLYFTLFTIRSSSIMYYFTYNLNNTSLIPFIGILGTLSGLPMLLALPKLTEKLGKKKSIILGAIIYSFGTLLMFMSKGGMVLILSGLVITGLGMYLMQGMCFAMAPDVIDNVEETSNRQIPGLITACQGFVAKCAMAVGSALIAALLQKSGYIANQAQTTEVLNSIEFSFIWIPIILSFLIIGLMYFYKLDRRENRSSDKKFEIEA